MAQKGFRTPKQLTKAQRAEMQKRNDMAVAFQKGYQEVVEKHKMHFGAGLFMDEASGVIYPAVRLINEDTDTKKSDKKRITAFHKEYKAFEDSSEFRLGATLFVDDTTNEVKAKIQIVPKPEVGISNPAESEKTTN